MHYMALPVSFRWDDEFVARIDEARGDVPRSAFVRRAVEQALSGKAPAKRNAEADQPRSAPAEQPYRQSVPGPNVEHVRSSERAKRDVKPIPKAGK